MTTTLVSVELLVLIFCFVQLTIGNPHLKDKPPSECSRILGCTAKNASTNYFKISLPLSLRFSESLRVPLMFHIRCTNLAQLSSLGANTLVVRNVMVVQVSGLAILLEYKVFSTILWNYTTFT